MAYGNVLNSYLKRLRCRLFTPTIFDFGVQQCVGFLNAFL
jgi:hypothetical protein